MRSFCLGLVVLSVGPVAIIHGGITGDWIELACGAIASLHTWSEYIEYVKDELRRN